MMTLKELKRKYMIEGYKLAKKRMLSESDQWVRDYDRRLDAEDRYNDKKRAELEEIDIYDKLIDAIAEDITYTLKSNKLKDTSQIREFFKGKSIDKIFSIIIPDVKELAGFLMEDYIADYDDFTVEDVINIITETGMDIAKQLANGKVPNEIGNVIFRSH